MADRPLKKHELEAMFEATDAARLARQERDMRSMDERVRIPRGDSELIDHLVTKVGWLVIGLATEQITLAEYGDGMRLARWRLRMALLAVKS